ncbi:ferritin family protein [bacterium]|nr:ferritin family protein [candidate division CSSED10-310 bacterium]
MEASKSIEIIKGAILLEHKGKSFYESVARTTPSAPVREIFSSMAMEEEKHIDILMKQYLNLKEEGKLKPEILPKNPLNFADRIITEKVKEEISGAGYEAAAVSAAIALEQQAVAFYSTRAQEVQDPVEKELFSWLAEWEKGHYDLLIAIDNELKEKIWFDQKFWPVI